ncbi:hypothetical protein A4X13_0g8753 [Tilletia indica]|uniref:Uncharacterized protein n=1 Tax=Tilletia indica TaxID=43049 RepID=A0A177T8N7_9BASI|nr:hypothetical protein A4X13_0g8753 [Tilletia indica]
MPLHPLNSRDDTPLPLSNQAAPTIEGQEGTPRQDGPVGAVEGISPSLALLHQQLERVGWALPVLKKAAREAIEAARGAHMNLRLVETLLSDSLTGEVVERELEGIFASWQEHGPPPHARMVEGYSLAPSTPLPSLASPNPPFYPFGPPQEPPHPAPALDYIPEYSRHSPPFTPLVVPRPLLSLSNPRAARGTYTPHTAATPSARPHTPPPERAPTTATPPATQGSESPKGVQFPLSKLPPDKHPQKKAARYSSDTAESSRTIQGPKCEEKKETVAVLSGDSGGRGDLGEVTETEDYPPSPTAVGDATADHQLELGGGLGDDSAYAAGNAFTWDILPVERLTVAKVKAWIASAAPYPSNTSAIPTLLLSSDDDDDGGGDDDDMTMAWAVSDD